MQTAKDLHDRLTRQLMGAEALLVRESLGWNLPDGFNRDLQEVCDLLCEIVEPKDLWDWFQTPNRAFSDLTPWLIIQSPGGIKRVRMAAEALIAGAGG